MAVVVPKPATFSLIVPCYNEEENIRAFYNRSKAVVENLCLDSYEFIFVDDGSKDNTLSEIIALAQSDESVRYLSFSRNFGKEAAMLAGLTYSQYSFVALMDVDMQDPPELLPEMFSKIAVGNGCECVATRRTSRTGEPAIRSLCANLFYKLINRISDVTIVSGTRDFRLMSRRMVDSILTLREKSRFSKGLFAWAGYKTEYIEYKNIERAGGQTKWSFWKLLKYSLDGIIAFSTGPLVATSVLGLFLCAGSFLAILFFIVQKLFIGIGVQGYAMLICVIFFLGGIQLLGLGILGQYISKIFTEVKGRPDYVVLQTNIHKEPKP